MEMTTGASRGELLEWINSTLHLNLTKIEETASGRSGCLGQRLGAVACQIIDKLFPGTAVFCDLKWRHGSHAESEFCSEGAL